MLGAAFTIEARRPIYLPDDQLYLDCMHCDALMPRLSRRLLLSLLCGIGWQLCASAEPPTAMSPEPQQWQGFENVYKLSPRITSGSGPEGEEALAELARQGIQTVVSVDGATPPVALARKYGLGYVHIPIGYEGLSRDAELALSRVVRDCRGPLYIHCHHGKHRGPAAAAVACMAEGTVDRAGARHILATAGTGLNYRGLWRDVAQFTPPRPGELLPELCEVAIVSGLVQAMSSIDVAAEHLEQLAENQFRARADHPDLRAQREALILWEGFREAARLSAEVQMPAAEYAPELHQGLAAAQANAARLRTLLANGESAAAREQLFAIRASCTTCHEGHRDHR